MRSGENDAELVRRAQSGDREAFGLLLERHRPMLVAVCRRLINGRPFADDIAQEAALEAWLNLRTLRQPGRFGSWLIGIGLNLSRTWLRQTRRELWLPEDLDGGRWSNDYISSGSGLEDHAESAELAELVRQGIAGLPPGQRDAVALFYLDGLSYLETAELLGIAVGAVRTRLHKARDTLRRELRSHWKEDLAMNTVPLPIRVEIVDVRRTQPSPAEAPKYVVMLNEVEGTRSLTIWIGEAEAGALALSFTGVHYHRPGPYHLTANILQTLGGRLNEARISKLADDVYYATAFITAAGRTETFDARPSDVLNLALLTNAPITVEPSVIAAAESAPARSPNEFQDQAASTVGAAEIVAEITAKWTK